MSSRSGVEGVEVAVVAVAEEDLAEKARRGSRIESGGRRAQGGIGRGGGGNLFQIPLLEILGEESVIPLLAQFDLPNRNATSAEG